MTTLNVSLKTLVNLINETSDSGLEVYSDVCFKTVDWDTIEENGEPLGLWDCVVTGVDGDTFEVTGSQGCSGFGRTISVKFDINDGSVKSFESSTSKHTHTNEDLEQAYKNLEEGVWKLTLQSLSIDIDNVTIEADL